MVEVFALVIYSVQWLGVVLGVGAEVVLLVAHLMALHQHKPEWLGSVPAVRAAQGLGLVLIVASGAGAVGYQFLIGQPDLLVLPVFGFKWALIGALAGGFFLEKNLTRGRALLEGFVGATWLALFLVHSIAPISPWLDLSVFYAGWLLVFVIVWGAFVLLMKYTGHTSAKPFSQKSSAQKISPPPPAPKLIIKPAPVVVHAPAPAPVHVAAPAPKPAPVHIVVPAPVVHPVAAATVVPVKPAVKKESFWHKLVSFFAKKPKAVPAAVAPVVVAAPAKPVQAPPPPKLVPVVVPKPPVVAAKPVAPPVKPAGLPATVPLELMAPHPAAPVAKAPAAPGYAPDYSNMPGLRVMPQRPEDLHQENRGPLVQPA